MSILSREFGSFFEFSTSIGSLGKSNEWAAVQDVMVDGAYLSNTQNGVRIKTWQVMAYVI